LPDIYLFCGVLILFGLVVIIGLLGIIASFIAYMMWYRNSFGG
jgi:hypothetical protein